jgi:hypothetical protein
MKKIEEDIFKIKNRNKISEIFIQSVILFIKMV